MKKQIIDQASHFMTALAILWLFSSVDVVLIGAFSGFMIGLIREITEEGETVTVQGIRDALGSWLDLSFWTLGGLVAKCLIMV